MRTMLLTIVLLFGATAAQADNGLFYVGAGVGRDTDSDFSGTPWKVLAGFRPIRLFAVEANYIDLGTQTTLCFNDNGGSCGSTHTQYKAFGGYAVGFAPIPVPYLDVFGKLGVQRWSSNTDFGPSLGSFSQHASEFAWGIGAQLHVGNIGGRLEYEGFHVPSANPNVISLSVILSLF
jgi:hypothetical protein